MLFGCAISLVVRQHSNRFPAVIPARKRLEYWHKHWVRDSVTHGKIKPCDHAQVRCCCIDTAKLTLEEASMDALVCNQVPSIPGAQDARSSTRLLTDALQHVD